MSRKRKKRKPDMIQNSLEAIIKKINIDNKYDVPYIAGCNEAGNKVYIDRRLPLYMPIKGKKRKKIRIDKYIVLHEIVEKALTLLIKDIHYEYAHEIATLAEKNALEKSRINMKTYDNFISKYAQVIEKEEVIKPPPDLDLKPYKDEKDFELVRYLKKSKKG